MRSLREVLPASVLARLGQQILEGVNHAVPHYPQLKGDEDAVTGGLIQSISALAHGTDPQTGYSWKATAWKLRGRGPGAPEKTTGADAIFEVQVLAESNRLVTRKSLPIQAKKEWMSRDGLLQSQATKLSEIPGGGIVVDYTPHGYFATDAETAAFADGHRQRIPPERMRPLGLMLANEFLACHIGSSNIYFDANEEILLVEVDGSFEAVPFTARHRLRVAVHLPKHRRK